MYRKLVHELAARSVRGIAFDLPGLGLQDTGGDLAVLDPAGYLRSIYAVRERSKLVLEKAKKNQLKHFTVDMSKFGDVASFVVSIIKVSLILRAQGYHVGRQRALTLPAARLCA